MVARGSADLSVHVVLALGFRGCLIVTLCASIGCAVVCVDVTALFRAFLGQQLAVQQQKRAFQLASDSVTQFFWSQAASVAAPSASAAAAKGLPMLLNLVR